MRAKRASLLLLLLAGPAWAGEPAVKLPTEGRARPGRLTLIRAETEGKALRWVSLSEGAGLLPYLDKQAIFSASAPGRYRILAYTAAGDVPSEPAWTAPSMPAEAACRPPGERATPSTRSVCPVKAASSCPRATSQRRTVRSLPPETARLPSGEQATPLTPSVWPPKRRT